MKHANQTTSSSTAATVVEFIGTGALTLLVGRQQGDPACKKTGCWFVGDDDLTGTWHVL